MHTIQGGNEKNEECRAMPKAVLAVVRYQGKNDDEDDDDGDGEDDDGGDNDGSVGREDDDGGDNDGSVGRKDDDGGDNDEENNGNSSFDCDVIAIESVWSKE